MPERIDGIVQTLLQHERAQGYLPIWTVWGQETWCMIGNPALPVLAHAIATGFDGFDRREALAAMVASSTAARPTAPANARRGWSVYEQYGYLPYGQVDGESVSKTLEYAWGDDAVRRVAEALGDHAVAERFAVRARSYRRLFDPAGFVALVGGAHATGGWLDRFIATESPVSDRYLGQEGVIGQYAQGNEPSHHVAYLYDWTDRAWRGHALIRRVAREFYTDVGAPLVESASIRLAGGRRLTIRAAGEDDARPWTESVHLDGRRLDPIALHHADLVRGGRLDFQMAAAPE